LAFKEADYQSMSARSALAVISIEKGQLSLTGSHYALSNEPKMNSVRCPWAPQRGVQKHKRAVFGKKSALFSKKVCYKLSLCENRQQQSYKANIH